MFHGPLSYCATNDLYGRARLLVNTSDIEGFPNSYLQAWVRGVPVVTLIDPDGVIAREGLGVAVASPEEFPAAIGELLGDSGKWRAASERCRAFMAREYGEDQVLSVYLETFESVMRAGTGRSEMIMSGDAPRA
jgi:glycosyltransferase involved in cell wall biosynthesis